MPAERVFWSYEDRAQNNPTPNEEEVINSAEQENTVNDSAESDNEFTYSGKGRMMGSGKSKMKLGGKLKAFGAVGFIVAILAIFVGFFSIANIVPAAITARLNEEANLEGSYMKEVGFIEIQAAMKGQDANGEDTGKGGDLPDNVVENLKSKGVLVGYPDESAEGGFKEANNLESGSLYLKIDDKVVSADNFITEVHSNAKLYSAINTAAYLNTASYHDATWEKMLEKAGIKRDIFNGESDFNETMTEAVGSGSNIRTISAKASEQEMESISTSSGSCTIHNDPRNGGEFRVCDRNVDNTYKSESGFADKNSGDGVSDFVDVVIEKHTAGNSVTATQNAADTLKAADVIAMTQKSVKYAVSMLQNVDKTRVGEGNEAQLNGMMNFLNTAAESVTIDVNTGEEIKSYGTPLEADEFYAIMTGSKYDASLSKNQSADRVLKTIEIRGMGGVSSISTDVIKGTVTAPKSDLKGDIGRYLEDNETVQATKDQLMVSEGILKESLVDNSFENFKGKKGGSALVNGAVEYYGIQAKGSGGGPGDEQAADAYLKLHSDILALDAEADRINRSPFDITSKNTFLGSIVYNMAVSLYYNKSNNSILSGMVSFIQTTAKAVNTLLPMAHAEDTNLYLSSYGVDCETMTNIVHAVGTPQCTQLSVFDLSTLDDPLNNESYKNALKKNTEGSSVKEDSAFTEYIDNATRQSQVGMTDSEILDKLVKTKECKKIQDEEIGIFGMVLSGENGRKDCGEEIVFTPVSEAAQAGISTGVNIGIGENTGRSESILDKVVDFFRDFVKTVVDALDKTIAALLKYKIAEKEDPTLIEKANGSWYANTEENRSKGIWDEYKWAQFYIAANRKMEQLRMFAVNYDGRVAYDIPGFEWEENPVVAYMRKSDEEDIEIAEEEEPKEEKREYSEEDIAEIFAYLDENPEVKEIIETELAYYGVDINQLAPR